jgi:hypothetical protein
VAITVCLEANHRRKYESIHGQGTFPLQAADPSKLRRECFHDRYWDPLYGRKKMTRTWDRKQGFAIIARVLDMLIKMGGAPTTTPTTTKSLPLTGWEAFYHDWTLTPELAARLIHERGPAWASYSSPMSIIKSRGRWYIEVAAARSGVRYRTMAPAAFTLSCATSTAIRTASCRYASSTTTALRGTGGGSPSASSILCMCSELLR